MRDRVLPGCPCCRVVCALGGPRPSTPCVGGSLQSRGGCPGAAGVPRRHLEERGVADGCLLWSLVLVVWSCCCWTDPRASWEGDGVVWRRAFRFPSGTLSNASFLSGLAAPKPGHSPHSSVLPSAPALNTASRLFGCLHLVVHSHWLVPLCCSVRAAACWACELSPRGVPPRFCSLSPVVLQPRRP